MAGSLLCIFFLPLIFVGNQLLLNRRVYILTILGIVSMETKVIRTEERQGIIVILEENRIKDMVNYSITTFLKENNMELSSSVFDTLRKANNKFNREIGK